MVFYLASDLVYRMEELAMKAATELLASLKEIRQRLDALSSDPAKHELDLDAVVDLNMAKMSVDKLVNRVERLVN
jgi:hypothetical protein